MRLPSGEVVKSGYYKRVKRALDKNDSRVSPENAIEFIYCEFDEIKDCYENSNLPIPFGIEECVNAFEKLYDVLDDEIFEISTNVFFKCVSWFFTHCDIGLDDYKYLCNSEVDEVFRLSALL